MFCLAYIKNVMRANASGRDRFRSQGMLLTVNGGIQEQRMIRNFRWASEMGQQSGYSSLLYTACFRLFFIRILPSLEPRRRLLIINLPVNLLFIQPREHLARLRFSKNVTEIFNYLLIISEDGKNGNVFSCSGWKTIKYL